MTIETPPGYTAFSVDTIADYIADKPELMNRLGGDASQLRATEVGDGNLNLVFIVEGPDDTVIIKQALPYVRLVGESWPLPLKRSFFEYNALVRQAKACSVTARVPEIYLYDDAHALVAMEYLSNHIILRKGLIAGVVYPKIARDIGLFMAETLFRTSDLHMDAGEKKKDVALFSDNVELCDITESLVFTDPYHDAELNSWTTPQLDQLALGLRSDRDLKIAVSEMKQRFVTHAEALVHGDLHSGSVMVNADDTRVIDPEFAFYGPMGFDVGALIANYFLAYFSQAGHEPEPGARDEYRAWILETIIETWDVFEARFRELWMSERTGVLYPRSIFEDQGDAIGAEEALNGFLKQLQEDTIGFAGAKMIRRLVGLAHVEDMQSIEDPDRRASCEAKALAMGRELLVDRAKFTGMKRLCELAKRIETTGASA
ncbi:MAG: methylthioribose kinase [Rhizobiaceae bacterium MnEN-MB40S]|nr:MAG: methylthioribose kinase [Rhizobiaceae bacterium MnEN-MB40S]